MSLFTRTQKHRRLSFFNTISGEVEAFNPIKGRSVKMYSCGPTVYDYVHIGNLRAFVTADMVKRALLAEGYDVNHTMNITDFGHLTDDADAGEDKMMKALRREGKAPTLEAMSAVADRYTDAFKEDVANLNIIPPTQYTRASAYVKEQIALIRTLVEKGYTYETSDGVYFDITQFPTYGKLGNIDLAKLKEGARVEVNPEKRHPADFALWKKGDLGWESAWGKGFPGWHIECTAMSFATLGKQIDIHTGGIDLANTHHNGEIAQAEAATGKAPYVKYWIHNAFISIEHTKISKSLGNTISLRNLLDRGYPALSYRYWLLTGHYRSPMNFTFEALDGAKHALFRLKRHIHEEWYEEWKDEPGTVSATYQTRFMDAIRDDLDTPKAIATMWEMVKDKEILPRDKVATLYDMDKVLGLELHAVERGAGKMLDVVSLPHDVQELIAAREAARARKAWDEADLIRTNINLKGYLIEDTPSGVRITKA